MTPCKPPSEPWATSGQCVWGPLWLAAGEPWASGPHPCYAQCRDCRHTWTRPAVLWAAEKLSPRRPWWPHRVQYGARGLRVSHIGPAASPCVKTHPLLRASHQGSGEQDVAVAQGRTLGGGPHRAGARGTHTHGRPSSLEETVAPSSPGATCATALEGQQGFQAPSPSGGFALV